MNLSLIAMVCSYYNPASFPILNSPIIYSTGWAINLFAAKSCVLCWSQKRSHWQCALLQTAPPYWLNLDPSWKGTGPPMHRYFHPDGTQTADPTDKVWGGHECRYSLVTSFVDGGRIREHYVRINRWPRMSVSRKEDWSWELSNHLYCYSSIPDADKKCGTGPFYPVWHETSYWWNILLVQF